jgi:hypothetical protein
VSGIVFRLRSGVTRNPEEAMSATMASLTPLEFDIEQHLRLDGYMGCCSKNPSLGKR